VPTKTIALSDIAAIASGGVPGSAFPDGLQPGLEATRYFTPPQPTYASGAHVAVVRVDPQTGFVKVLRYAVAHDCGRVINPMIVDGQIHGGVAHGIGDALFENLQYDENGQLQTTSYLNYLIPTSFDVPSIDTEHIEIPSRFNALGVKGAGEAGAIGAPAAITNAIADALSPLGVSIEEFPLIPSRIWQLIHENCSCREEQSVRVKREGGL
jgi:carbon-monoxide dehydrogenase large subunit